MMSYKWLLLVPVLLWLAYQSVFTVDAGEYVYLTQFGRRVAVYDGGDAADAGLHLKWPWPIQSVQRLDRTLQVFDLPGAELLTRDPKGNTIDKTLTIDAYVCWRIAGSEGADRFVRTVGSAEGAQLILGQRVGSELGAAIAELELDDLITTDPKRIDDQRERLRQRLLDGGSPSLRLSADQEYGIEVVDVRLRRTNHPAAVREAIFDRIRSERAKKVAEYQSEGERLAADIRSASAREVAQMKADAEARAIQLRGAADAEADRIRNEAQRADPRFYAFLRKLEDYQRILGDGKSMLLLSTHRELFDLLYDPPVPGSSRGGKLSEPAGSSRRDKPGGSLDKPGGSLDKSGGSLDKSGGSPSSSTVPPRQ
jgi:membrane protease subunit HflC